jgi:hypothetical protein
MTKMFCKSMWKKIILIEKIVFLYNLTSHLKKDYQKIKNEKIKIIELIFIWENKNV